MLVNKAYKFRIYPTKKQEILIAKTIGCSRYVFNFIQQKSPTSISGEMNAKRAYNSVGVHKPLLNKVKASGGCHRFLEEFIERAR